MPEGDTVLLTARRLHRALAGAVLTATDFRVPALATLDLTGVPVRDVHSVGKHLLLRLGDASTVHSHLLMDGRWTLERHRTSGGSPRGSRHHEVRAVLATEQHLAVGWRLALVERLPTAEEARVVGHLGPDLLASSWDGTRALSRLLRESERPIGSALLDQRNLAGLGTIYASELCFLRGVSPWTPVGAVPELPRMLALARQLLLTNVERGVQVTSGRTARGQEHWVYRRRHCLRCGVPTSVAVVAPHGRRLWWCPACQRRARESSDLRPVRTPPGRTDRPER